jgi:hypothetical protein
MAQVQEMAMIALQNCCYGDDPHAITRRQKSAESGALEAVVQAIKTHNTNGPMVDVGAATLRLLVHRVADLRQRAMDAGAQAEWVKPIALGGGGGGILSFRKLGFGTSRRRNK